MRRYIILLFIIGFGMIYAAAAQDPATTPEASAPLVEATPVTPQAEAQPIDPAATSAPTMGPEIPLLVNVWTDMETLAISLFGSERPAGWNGELDINNPQLALLLRLNLEVLAGAQLGANQRPAGWFGAVPSTPFAIARDVRHDLELLADNVVGLNIRPENWVGDDPLMRCNRATQTLVNFLERAGVFILAVDPNVPDYCHQVETQASQFAEINLLSSPDVRVTGLQSQQPTGDATVNTRFAVAFLDRGATRRVGIIPEGTPINVLGRSYAQFSKMVLVSGPDFEVYVDYQFTDVTAERFDVLPDVAVLTSTPVCAASWCSAG